ncbi:PucR family transcriptional regulator [Kocuria sp. M1R5S2]|uniref:PucR family transcriptional regulator n=1 Tax=Kocuria rhizosphaerae TaxID=3376285 RepID=UPI0037A5FE50
MITVTDVLTLRGLGLETVVAADTAAPVSWVVTSELADPTPYLDGGEVVLLTGVNTAVRGCSWAGYVHRLAERGVVALGMGVGDHLSYSSVPAELVQACRETGLTLFSVPERTPFLGIIRATADMRAAQERADVEMMLAKQRALVKAAVAAEGPAEVVRSLAGLLPGGWAGVCTADAALVERSGPPPDLPSDRTLTELVARLRPAGLRGSLRESGPRGSLIVHPLGVHGTPESYLVVVVPRPLERSQAGVITTAVALLSLHAERAAEQALFRRRVHAGAAALLLGGDPRSAQALLAVLGEGTWPAPGRLVRAVRLLGAADQVRETVRRTEARPGARPVLAGTPVPEPAGRASVGLLVEDDPGQLAGLRDAVGSTGPRAGIGGAVPVEEAATSDVQALETLERTTARHPVGAWDDVVAGGIAGLVPPEAARIYADELLLPLRSHHDGEERLVPVLRAFLAHNGNRRRAAAELGIHRNTFQQRVELVEQALGRSLDDPQARAELWIALGLTRT